MQTKPYRYTCPATSVRVIVIQQTYTAIAGIGDDVNYLQSDYDCSYQNQCDSRYDRTCKIYCLNTGETYAPP